MMRWRLCVLRKHLPTLQIRRRRAQRYGRKEAPILRKHQQYLRERALPR